MGVPRGDVRVPAQDACDNALVVGDGTTKLMTEGVLEEGEQLPGRTQAVSLLELIRQGR